jgi:hypothetical protein
MKGGDIRELKQEEKGLAGSGYEVRVIWDL